MRTNIIIALAAILILAGCANTDNPGQASTAPEKTLSKADTLIHSSPADYTKMLETISPDQKLVLDSYKELLDLFAQHNYTQESWKAGLREIPRIYLTKIGDRWGNTTTKEITVQNKKQIFFRAIAPLILRANELILEDRSRLQDIRTSFNENKPLSDMDQIWIQKLMATYKLKNKDAQLSSSVFNELLKKVDIVPPALALAQGAEESGWGTSRFAEEGNALYGQWTWGKNAMVPDEQRKELGNYGIASFPSLQESICGYMINLNTHNAYSDLRNKRAELRKNGELISGDVLAEQLTKYSERGQDYVDGLKSMMNYNHLGPVDSTYLSKDAPIYLIPVDE